MLEATLPDPVPDSSWRVLCCMRGLSGCYLCLHVLCKAVMRHLEFTESVPDIGRVGDRRNEPQVHHNIVLLTG